LIRFYKTRPWMRKLLPGYTWRKKVEAKTLYLTFDDGPIPGVTPFVLDQLKEYGALATFFCVGENLHRYPEIGQRMVQEGHVLANHTYNHLKGWQTPFDSYLQNVALCSEELLKQHVTNKLFRPPYGRITGRQAAQLRQEGYELVMWDVLTNDYDTSLAPETCLQQSVRYTESGSIVVFHDSVKAQQNIMHVLPRYLEHFATRGYAFKTL
jgi:peptidoglycan-N-acetylglucosamine deacetylase